MDVVNVIVDLTDRWIVMTRRVVSTLPDGMIYTYVCVCIETTFLSLSPFLEISIKIRKRVNHKMCLHLSLKLLS